MMKRSRVLLSFILCLSIFSFDFSIQAVNAQEPITGEVTKVTLYRQQALVTRQIAVSGEAGSHEVVITNLPDQIVEGSIFAEGPDGIEVRAVRLRTRAVGEEPREEVRKLDEQIQEVNDQITANKMTSDLLTKRGAYLDKMETFSAGTSNADLSKGVLDAEALQKLTMFLFEQRSEISDKQLSLTKESRDLNKQLQLLQRKRAELTGNATQNVREAVLFLEKHDDKDESVRLNYIVKNCGWSPSYTFRAGEDVLRGENPVAPKVESPTTGEELKKVRAEYSAMIYQMTGEDWDNVVLTLSTASPALASSGPGLAPFHISLNPIAPQQKQQLQQRKGQIAKQFKTLQSQQMMANDMNRNAYSIKGNIDSSWGVNYAACNINLLELTNGKDILGNLELTSVGIGDEPSLSYELGSNISLSSRSDQQMVRILQTSIEGEFYHVATPVLTSYVYREAELTNASGHDLLAGPITVYIDGRFVGRGEVPTVAQGQTFVVGFGADAQLRVRRELAARNDEVQGGNREISIDYRLVVDNFKKEPVSLRIYDRLPYTNSSGDVRITLQESADKLSNDKLYLRRERNKGILRFDLHVAVGDTGENARILEYGYKIEHDRNYQLTILSDQVERLQEEFESLQRGRFVR